MSKSLGNVVETSKLLEKNSADLCRFYMMRKCSPIDFMNFDMQELNRRPYQVLSTLYHLSRFFMDNATFDEFSASKYTLEWAFELGKMGAADLWLLSKLEEKIETYTSKLELCEFNAAVAVLDDFVIETLSRLYVPMIRKELWTDEPETFERRQTIYALLHHALKTVTLLFNPVTPYLSEALFQKIYRKLEPQLPETINLASWPISNEKFRNKKLEEQFETLLKAVSISYASRQTGKLKRRWPLSKAIVVAPQKTLDHIKNLETLFLDQVNVKAVEYATQIPEYVGGENWVSSQEDEITVFVSGQRDDRLLGEGIMRDLARRVQALRKEMGFVPTEVLESVHIAELDGENVGLLEPYLDEMASLVRARKIYLNASRKEEQDAEWHESELDGKKIYLNIH
jgi:isoleucyl-tRNA synthetase